MYDSVMSDMLELRNEINTEFWKEKLKDYERLDIFTREKVDQHVHKVYDEELSAKVLAKCKEDSITPKSLFFSAYLYVLSLISSQKDITAGLVSHRRPMVEDGDKLLGCFLNTVPFRYDMHRSKGYSWLEYIRAIEIDLCELRGKDRFSLNEISTVSGQKALSNPFFDVLFNYVDFHVLNGLYDNDDFQALQSKREIEDFSFQDFERANTHLDFTFSLTRTTLSLTLINTRKLKSNHQLNNLVEYFENFLCNYLYHSDEPLDNLKLLSVAERGQLLESFNATQVTYPAGEDLVSLFTAQVQQHPDMVALIYQDQQLTYAQLDGASTRFARYLQAHYGLTREDRVALKLERSHWAIVALLGVLKAGAAYVPIDPQYPAARVAYIEADSQCRLCVDEAELAHFLDEQEQYGASALTLVCRPEDLAYMIYTSGSTGLPKGVMIEHRNVVNSILALIESYGVADCQRSLGLASFSFDGSIAEIFITLLGGATLYVVDEATRKSPELLGHYLVAHQIELATLPPIYLKLMNLGQLASLKHLVTAGEAPIYEAVQAYLAQGTGIYHNGYGPTEVSICGSTHTLPTLAALPATGSISIGRPIANANIYILDAFGQVQPIGVAGEIYIGGAGLARGYWNRPELTAQRFIANPYGAGRLYRTGDVGRWLADGTIEFAGRNDDQVSIRGYRVELGEIEGQLSQKDGMQTTIALLVEREDKEKQLVAYYMSHEKQTTAELRSYLSTKLPAYMLPDEYVQVDSVPLTANGKIDVKALASLMSVESYSGMNYVAPRDKVEEKLIVIWEEILQRGGIGVQNSFFEMGGNSLKAIQVIARIRNEFSMTIDVATLYRNPTIEHIRLYIENSAWVNDGLNEEDQEVERFEF